MHPLNVGIKYLLRNYTLGNGGTKHATKEMNVTVTFERIPVSSTVDTAIK